MYKKKVASAVGMNPHTAAAIRKAVLTPPPKKRGTHVRGAGGVKIEEFIGGSFSLLK